VLVPWTTVALALGGAAALSAVLLAMALRNPRLMLQDYPKDVQASVPPKTTAERPTAVSTSGPLRTVRWYRTL
jgi:hypothetical protein